MGVAAAAWEVEVGVAAEAREVEVGVAVTAASAAFRVQNSQYQSPSGISASRMGGTMHSKWKACGE